MMILPYFRDDENLLRKKQQTDTSLRKRCSAIYCFFLTAFIVFKDTNFIPQAEEQSLPTMPSFPEVLFSVARTGRALLQWDWFFRRCLPIAEFLFHSLQFSLLSFSVCSAAVSVLLCKTVRRWNHEQRELLPGFLFLF